MWSDSDGGSDSEGKEAEPEEELTFGVNKSYAARFELRKKKQELARLKEKHKDNESDSDASSEDEDGELLTPALDMQIFKTIDKIRNKRPEIYEPDVKFFDKSDGGGEEDPQDDDDDDDDENDEAEEAEEAKPKHKSMTLKQQLLEQGATALVSDDEDDDDAGDRRGRSLAYDAEQRELRKAFLKESGAADDGEEEESDDEGGGTGGAGGSSRGSSGMLRKKAVSHEQRDIEQAEYSAWLQHQLQQQEHKGGGEVDEAVTLRRYMFGEQLNEEERFLRDYVLNAMWKGPGAEKAHEKTRNKNSEENESEDEGKGKKATQKGGKREHKTVQGLGEWDRRGHSTVRVWWRGP